MNVKLLVLVAAKLVADKNHFIQGRLIPISPQQVVIHRCTAV